jgi:RimJ/RimL family protein N-acetyltransferase
MLLIVLDNLFGKRIPNGKLEKVSAFVDSKNTPSTSAHQRIGMKRKADTKDSDNPKITYHHYELNHGSWKKIKSNLEARVNHK